MYFREFGPANAPTVLLLHGGGVGGWSWSPEIERLTDYHLLVPDLPGQGRSIADGAFTFEKAVGALAQLIRDRGHQSRAHVVGLSLGAQTGVHLLSAAPELFHSALLSGTLARLIPGAGLIRPLLWLYNPFKDLPLMIRANMASLEVPREYFAQFAEDTRSATIDSMAGTFAANMRFAPPDLGHTTCPVLFLVGEREYGLMRSSARDLASLTPGAEARLVKGVGHNWPLQHPDLFTRVLRAWLARAPLPPELASL